MKQIIVVLVLIFTVSTAIAEEMATYRTGNATATRCLSTYHLAVASKSPEEVTDLLFDHFAADQLGLFMAYINKGKNYNPNKSEAYNYEYTNTWDTLAQKGEYSGILQLAYCVSWAQEQ